MAVQQEIKDSDGDEGRLWPLTVPTDAPSVAQGIRDPLHFGVAQRLRQARRLAGLGVTVVATRAGLSQSTALMIESGAVPHLDVVEALAGVLGVTPGWLAYARPREAVQQAPQGEEGAGDVEAGHLGCGARLREAREEAGLSVRALAKGAGCSDTAVRTIENGDVVPGVDTIERLADALGVAPGWLAFGEGEGPE